MQKLLIFGPILHLLLNIDVNNNYFQSTALVIMYMIKLIIVSLVNNLIEHSI